ncbi:MAG: glycosyltransferase family 2 protein [Ardenticatenaceae bacterium]|nr:glycosyltransferase family 2 protein [Ardenticatenaceae bacterium]MCB9446239.1 glycosyltransferase family 2 protein [Ardenticatenaceae bacterium]
MPYLSVIIPAYNEEKRIATTLDAIYRYLTTQPFTWEMLIVLDGPQDNTLGQVQAFAQGKQNIRWIDRKQNRGKGYSVREGMLQAHGDIRLFTDADNSTDISHFNQMRPLFEQGKDVVIASRDHKDVPGARQAVPQPPLKRLLGNLGNLIIQTLVVPGIWDTRCGFKAFTAPAAKQVFAAARIDGWSIDDEALALTRRFGYRIGIIAADWIDAAGTHVTRLDYIKSIGEAVKIRWNLLTGVYKRSRPETPLATPKM